MNRRIICLFLVLACGLCRTGIAQDLTGIWRGHFRSNDEFERLTGYDDRYKIEVQIAQTKEIFQAVTYSYKSTEFYGKASASGTLNPKTKKVLLREMKILEVRMAGGDVCIMTCFLQYSRLGDDEFLEGTYTSASIRDSLAGCGKGTIFLHKVQTSDFEMEPFLEKKEKELLSENKKKAETAPRKSTAGKPDKKTVAINGKSARPSPPKAGAAAPAGKPHPSPKALAGKGSGHPKNLPPPPEKKSVMLVPEERRSGPDSVLKIESRPIPVPLPAELANRSNEVIRSITVTNTEIYLFIYDDGAIDNDTVSVYYDNKRIVSGARISDQPVKATIRVGPSDQPHKLTMVAENLGDIPPNTSLLVVRDGDKKYEVRIVSTEQKNAVINFQYKKPE